MVFGNGDHHFVALFQMVFPITPGNQVQAFGGVPHKDHFFEMLGVDELPHRFPGLVIQFPGFDGQHMGSPVGVPVVVFQQVHQSMDHLIGFLGGGRIVQVHQRMSVVDFSQDGEISAYIYHGNFLSGGRTAFSSVQPGAPCFPDFHLPAGRLPAGCCFPR